MRAPDASEEAEDIRLTRFFGFLFRLYPAVVFRGVCTVDDCVDKVVFSVSLMFIICSKSFIHSKLLEVFWLYFYFHPTEIRVPISELRSLMQTENLIVKGQ